VVDDVSRATDAIEAASASMAGPRRTDLTIRWRSLEALVVV